MFSAQHGLPKPPCLHLKESSTSTLGRKTAVAIITAEDWKVTTTNIGKTCFRCRDNISTSGMTLPGVLATKAS